MTEFERFWARQDQTKCTKEFAMHIWNCAQIVCLRLVSEPPHIPAVGEKIKLLSLCHPLAIGKVKEVVSVDKYKLDCYWVGTKETRGDGEDYFSGGVLGEVEKQP